MPPRDLSVDPRGLMGQRRDHPHHLQDDHDAYEQKNHGHDLSHQRQRGWYLDIGLEIGQQDGQHEDQDQSAGHTYIQQHPFVLSFSADSRTSPSGVE